MNIKIVKEKNQTKIFFAYKRAMFCACMFRTIFCKILPKIKQKP